MQSWSVFPVGFLYCRYATNKTVYTGRWKCHIGSEERDAIALSVSCCTISSSDGSTNKIFFVYLLGLRPVQFCA